MPSSSQVLDFWRINVNSEGLGDSNIALASYSFPLREAGERYMKETIFHIRINKNRKEGMSDLPTSKPACSLLRAT